MKHRGQKRYYKKLKERDDLKLISELKLEDLENWFDLWHFHFDMEGYGNKSFRKRSAHLDRLFRHFELIAGNFKKQVREFQLFAVVSEKFSSEDALYIHTPNPNGDNFPYKVPNVSLISNFKNKELSCYLSGLKDFTVYYAEHNGEKYCLVYKENVGKIII